MNRDSFVLNPIVDAHLDNYVLYAGVSKANRRVVVYLAGFDLHNRCFLPSPSNLSPTEVGWTRSHSVPFCLTV